METIGINGGTYAPCTDERLGRKDLPLYMWRRIDDDTREEGVCRGGSHIIGPNGDMLVGLSWEMQNDQIEDAQGAFFVAGNGSQACKKGRLNLDVAGSYHRHNSLKLPL